MDHFIIVVLIFFVHVMNMNAQQLDNSLVEYNNKRIKTNSQSILFVCRKNIAYNNEIINLNIDNDQLVIMKNYETYNITNIFRERKKKRKFIEINENDKSFSKKNKKYRENENKDFIEIKEKYNEVKQHLTDILTEKKELEEQIKKERDENSRKMKEMENIFQSQFKQFEEQLKSIQNVSAHVSQPLQQSPFQN
ncbi:hypothetical protein RFI_39733 [Reticulomyxa filosa]|uniref:Uncharacterized protein n=1 Tax=Reticulomyxa filosa TaxID=46433 RepID=X6LAP0_RETFI|nr:hypothetical protein RFI_39733 [Reticulomyxa filosa]|eukprot:ETN97794.1 hypothetical protein RFI_39733 [Reticulomyxa filosa]